MVSYKHSLKFGMEEQILQFIQILYDGRDVSSGALSSIQTG